MPAPNYFELLELPRRFRLDEVELERRYLDKSRQHHPDRHVKSDGAARVRAALTTSELNQAYRVLRDPVKRAEYLLSLEGVELGEGKPGAAKVAPAFLMEIMELREALSEARAARDEAEVDALGRDVRSRREKSMATIAEDFAALETGQESKAAKLAALTDALVALRYYQRFLDELELHEEARLDP